MKSKQNPTENHNLRIDSKLREIKELVEELDPALEVDQVGYRIAVLLLSTLSQGANRQHLANFTRYPWEFIAEVSARMIVAGLWTDEEADTTHWFDESDSLRIVAFWADCLVGEGRLIRKRFPDGQFRYIAVEFAVEDPKPGPLVM